MLNKAHVQFYTPDRNVTREWLNILKTTQGHGQTSRKASEGWRTTYFSKTVVFSKPTDQNPNFADAAFVTLFYRLSILEEKKETSFQCSC